MAAAEEVPELTVILLGNNCKEKDSVVDLLFKKTEFNTDQETLDCTSHRGRINNKNLTVVNTQYWLLYRDFSDWWWAIIEHIKSLSAPGPHVFLLVLQPEDFTEEHNICLQSVLESFSEQAFHHSLVLLCPPRAQTPGFMDKYMRDPHIRDMIIKCRYRYLWMNLTKDEPNLEDFKHKELFTRIDRMMKENETLQDTAVEFLTTVDRKSNRKSSLISLCDSGESIAIQGVRYDTDCLRVVLIGKTGTGKSSSGNTILGRKQFVTKPSQTTVTKVCQKELTAVEGRTVAVVDTPGLFDTTMSSDEVDVERLRCVNLLAPGPHVFLLVFQLGRFTEEERKTVSQIKKGFGKGVEEFTIILLTHGDQLEDSGMSIDTFLTENSDDSFKQLISECGNRYHVFNNRNRNNRTQVKELLKKIDALVQENGGGCYTNDMLLKAEAAIKKEMEKEREEMERKYNQEIKDLKEVIEKEKEKNTFLVRNRNRILVEMMAMREDCRAREMKFWDENKEFDEQEDIECVMRLQQKEEKEKIRQERDIDSD